jgi:hypothetical protein
MGRGRKPASSRGKKAQWTVYLTPEEVEFLEGIAGTRKGKEGLYQILRQAMTGNPLASPKEKTTPTPAPGNTNRQDWCQRCRRLGMAICPACMALQGKGKG